MNECKNHRYSAEGEVTNVGCPYCEIDRLEAELKSVIKCPDCGAQYVTVQAGECPYCVVQLGNNEIAQLETELARYRNGVELKAIVVPYNDVVVWKGTVHIRLPKEMIGQRVKVLVMKGE